MSEYIKKTSIIGLAHKLRFGRILTDREVEVVEMVVNDVPAADVAPVRHGRWIKNDNGTWSCERCHSWIPDEQHYYARFCLYCGARMDGGADGDNNL